VALSCGDADEMEAVVGDFEGEVAGASVLALGGTPAAWADG